MSFVRWWAAGLAAAQLVVGSAALADLLPKKYLALAVVLVAASQAFLSAYQHPTVATRAMKAARKRFMAAQTTNQRPAMGVPVDPRLNLPIGTGSGFGWLAPGGQTWTPDPTIGDSTGIAGPVGRSAGGQAGGDREGMQAGAGQAEVQGPGDQAAG